jgi:hypothetical protein
MRFGLLVAAVAGLAAFSAFVLFSVAPSLAVQNPSISLDMLTAGNGYDDITNTMTIGTTENCLTSDAANANSHNHVTHLVIRDVEDLVAWQVRLNYVGDQMRPLSFNPTPFTDSNTGQPVGFTNLPIDSQTGLHRDVTPASTIPTPPPDGSDTPQTALIGATYSGTRTFETAADTPAKAAPDGGSYDAPSGGVLASLFLQVVGNESGKPSLLMNLDDADPVQPGSRTVVFTGSGTTELDVAATALGDGFHGEGSPCVPLDCVDPYCPLLVDIRTHTFTNTTPLPADALHIRMNEAVTPSIVQNAAGCPAPTISGDHSAGRVDLTWSTPCVESGESVTIEIRSWPAAHVNCSHWSLLGTALFGNCDAFGP